MQALGHKQTLKIGKFSGHPLNYTYHIIIPEELAIEIKALKLRRVLLNVNEKSTFHKPLLQYEGTYYMTLAATDRKKLRVDVGDDISVVLNKDDSTYQTEFPEEMKELLYQDPEANQLFHALTPGKQRSLLYLIQKVKSPNIRLNKALIIVDHLKANHGKLDFKMLNVAFKGG